MHGRKYHANKKTPQVIQTVAAAQQPETNESVKFPDGARLYRFFENGDIHSPGHVMFALGRERSSRDTYLLPGSETCSQRKIGFME